MKVMDAVNATDIPVGYYRFDVDQSNLTDGEVWSVWLDEWEMHGNLQIPAKYKTADGIWLGRWLYDQKVLLRKQSPRLSAEQTNKLRKLLDEDTAGKAC